MAKKVNIIGAKPQKIEILDRPKQRVEAAELAASLGANPVGLPTSGNLDPVALAELGTQLMHRLRSSGGRPALADATVNCRVPLSADDVMALEDIVSQIGASTGTKPSVGQIVSVIVRLHLNALNNAPTPPVTADAPTPTTEQARARNVLRQMIDEQIHPIREQVKRLESELHANHSGQE